MNLKKLFNLTTPKWYNLTAGATSDRIDITGVVGGSFFGDGTTAAGFIAEARSLTAPVLDVHINSPGGLVEDGVQIYNFLKGLGEQGRQVRCHIDGLAASIASVIAMAGDEIIMAENAMMLVHHPWNLCCGNAVAMRAAAADLEKVAGQMRNTYKARTGLTVARLEEIMTGPEGGDGTLMTAAEALAEGFVTAVSENKQAAACVGADIWAGMPAALALTDPEEEEEEEEEKPKGETDDDDDEDKPKGETDDDDDEDKPKGETDDDDDEDKPKGETGDDDDEDKEAKLKAARAEAAALRAQLNRLAGNALNPNRQKEGNKVVNWEQAKAACGGDFVKARLTYPLAYQAFMRANTPKK